MSRVELPACAMTIDELSGGFDDARDLLNPLAERARNVFGTWEWLSTWWRHFGHGALTLGLARGRDGEIAAMFALYRSGRRALRTLRFVGHGLGDQLGPVAVPEQMPEAAVALRRLLDELEWDVFVGHDLPDYAGWSGRRLYRTPTPLLEIEHETWDEFLDSRSQDFRRKARLEAKLERSHRVRHRLVEDPDELPRAMAALVRLHESRFGRASRAFAGRAGAFHLDFAAQALELGWLRLLFLEVDGRPVAGLYNFRFAGCEYDYQAGRDPAWDRWSVGFLARCRAVRMSIEDGLAEHRFLRGAEPYKLRFANRDPGVVTVGHADGPLGKAVLAGARREHDCPRLLRHCMPGPVSSWPAPRGVEAVA